MFHRWWWASSTLVYQFVLILWMLVQMRELAIAPYGAIQICKLNHWTFLIQEPIGEEIFVTFLPVLKRVCSWFQISKYRTHIFHDEALHIMQQPTSSILTSDTNIFNTCIINSLVSIFEVSLYIIIIVLLYYYYLNVTWQKVRALIGWSSKLDATNLHKNKLFYSASKFAASTGRDIFYLILSWCMEKDDGWSHDGVSDAKSHEIWTSRPIRRLRIYEYAIVV